MISRNASFMVPPSSALFPQFLLQNNNTVLHVKGLKWWAHTESQVSKLTFVPTAAPNVFFGSENDQNANCFTGHNFWDTAMKFDMVTQHICGNKVTYAFFDICTESWENIFVVYSYWIGQKLPIFRDKKSIFLALCTGIKKRIRNFVPTYVMSNHAKFHCCISKTVACETFFVSKNSVLSKTCSNLKFGYILLPDCYQIYQRVTLPNAILT